MDVDFIVIWKSSAKLNRTEPFYRWIYLPQKDIIISYFFKENIVYFVFNYFWKE